jgi:hypothetical protein
MDQFEEKKWFVFLGDHHEGPFSMAELVTKVNDKIVGPSSFVWAEGMTDWKLMREVPAFEGIEKQTSGAQLKTPSKEGPKKTEDLALLQAVSLPLERVPTATRPPMSSDEVEKSWKRRRRIRRSIKAAVFLAVVGGGTVIYKQGLLDAYISEAKVPPVVEAWVQSAMERSRPQLLSMADKYPVLKKVISPIPRLQDVTPEEYEALRGAAGAHLDAGGPVVAVVAAKEDPAHPAFYVSSNLPDGAKFDVYLEGVSETLVGKRHSSAKVTVAIAKNLGKTDPIRLAQGASLPMGEYQVFATESDQQPESVAAILKTLQPLNAAKTDRLPAGLKLLARRTYFLGGLKDDSYQQKLRDYHTQLAQKARIELADLKDLGNALDKQMQDTIRQFKAIRKGKGITAGKKKAWSKFHADWMRDQIAWLDRFSKITPESLRDEYVYADGYDLARQAGQELQKLHDMQNDYFENRLDERGLDIQLGSATSVVESAFMTFKTKVDQADKAPVTQTGTASSGT